MKVAFLGLRSSFDYYQIGGTESVVRRLAKGMIGEGDEVDYIAFGAQDEGIISPMSKLRLHYVKSFEQALALLLGGYDHVVSLYLSPWVRLRYLWFRLVHRERCKFYTFHFSMSSNFLKKELRWLDSKVGFDGVFVISPRLQKAAQRRGIATKVVLPPVPSRYSADINTKHRDGRIRVSYVGRTERSKGIDDVLDLFTALQDNDNLQLSIYGYHWPDDTYGEKMHRWLSRQKKINYVYAAYQGYTPELEERLRRLLWETDILVLPYRSPHTTIDMPMLVVEGMMCLCVIATRAFETIQEVYGQSPFVVGRPQSFKSISSLIQDVDKVHREQRRIAEVSLRQKFEASRVIAAFRSYLSNVSS